MLSVDELFKSRHLDHEISVLGVRWYLRCKLSFRDLVEMTDECGLSLAHTSIMRWVQRYVPLFEKRWNRFARRGADRGASTRLTSRSRAAGSISTAPSTRRERRRRFYCAPREMSPPPIRFRSGARKPRMSAVLSHAGRISGVTSSGAQTSRIASRRHTDSNSFFKIPEYSH
jgi:hypothetical protein